MIHQMNTPTKYAAIHGNGAGLFASYNRSIPKQNQGQGNRIRINDLSYKNENIYQQDGYSKIKEKVRNLNTTHEPPNKAEIAEFRVRSTSSSKKYRYTNDPGQISPGNRGCSGKKKKKKQYKGNYGDHHVGRKKESLLHSVMDKTPAGGQNDPNYKNTINTIPSTSSKTSNNTSCLVSTSSRNASITPRKIIAKATTKASPEKSQNYKQDRFGKGYLAQSKIHKAKMMPNPVKISNKNKIVKEKSIIATSGSNRAKLIKGKDPLNNTGSKMIKGKDVYKKIMNEIGM